MKPLSLTWNITAAFVCLGLLMFAHAVGAQSTINILGTSAPAPGPNDQYQTNFVAFGQSPPPGGGAFNYYVNADPAPGETFTTGSNPTGYILDSLALYDADNTGGGFGSETFTLAIYTVSEQTNAAVYASYTSQTVNLPDFNWFQWTNLGAILQPNTTYAYAMWANGSGWMNLGNTNGNFYSGGQVAIVPHIGGTMTFSSSSGWNADFDIGLAPITQVTVSQPAFSPYSITLPGSTVTASANVAGPMPYSYQWRTDGGSGGALTNIPGANSANLVINTTGYPLGNFQYALVASDSTSSATSQVAVLTIQQPAGIAGVIGIKFGFTNGYATSDAPFPADDAGVASGQLVPPSYQPLTAVGDWNDLMADITNNAPTAVKVAAMDQTWNINRDTTGNALSGVTLTAAGFDDGWFSGGTECADGRLLYDCWKFNNSNGQIDGFNNNYATITVANLPGATYDVYLYINDDNGNYWGNAEANSVIAIGSDVDQNDGFNGADSDPCDVNPSLHTAGGFGNPVNYVKMPYVATSGGTITITVVMQGGGDFGVSGVELVPSPDLVLSQDTLPSYAETVPGDQVVYTSAFNNTPPVNLQWLQTIGTTTNVISTGVINVTNNGVVTSTLTLNNVQAASSASYQLKAVNAANPSDYALSSAAPLVVSNTPVAVNGVVVDYSAQTGADPFYPAWTVNTANDLVYGFQDDSPEGAGNQGTVDAGPGNFSGQNSDNANGDPAILSDGILGDSKSMLDACGTTGAGEYVIYNLITNTATLGYDLTNLQVYGGWTDSGRRDQEYQVLYATVDNPTNFISLVSQHYLPGDPSGSAEATRTTLVPTGGVLAHNVCEVEINWNITPQYLNGYGGYSEVVIGGTNSTQIALVAPLITSFTRSGANLIVTGSGGLPINAAYDWLSTTNLNPPIHWMTNLTGNLDGTGAFSNSIPINPAQPAAFFQLKMY